MKNNNPFILTFGRNPINLINRDLAKKEIIENFESENKNKQVYMITGLRGSGKTVLLNNLKDYFAKKEWIIITLNIESDMISLSLSQFNDLKKKISTELGLSIGSLNINFKKEKSRNDETNLINIVKELSKKNKNILFLIDDAYTTQSLKVFAHTFQTMLQDNLNVYIIMTGLYENITTIQTQKTLTFLARASKIEITSLDLSLIYDSYLKTLNVDNETAIELTKLSKGYAYAYQVLGYLMFNSNSKKINDDLLREYDKYLSSDVYTFIFNNLSNKEKEFLFLLVDSNGSIKNIKFNDNFTKQDVSVYRQRLIERGLLISSGVALLDFVLPRFKEFLIKKKLFY